MDLKDQTLGDLKDVLQENLRGEVEGVDDEKPLVLNYVEGTLSLKSNLFWWQTLSM